MNKVYLLLGSNMGNSAEQLSIATDQLEKQVGSITRRSSLYRTAAWGMHDQPDFLNQVIVLEVILTATNTLEKILSIEKQMGRVRTIKNAPRIIDIDILFFNKDIIYQPDLVVPHPQLPNRRFVLVPLNELSPAFVHPELHKSIHQLLAECPDKLDVKKF